MTVTEGGVAARPAEAEQARVGEDACDKSDAKKPRNHTALVLATVGAVAIGILGFRVGTDRAEDRAAKMLEDTVALGPTGILALVDEIKAGQDGQTVAEMSLEPGNPEACPYDFIVHNQAGDTFVTLDTSNSQFAGKSREIRGRDEAEPTLTELNQLFPCN